MENEEWCQAFFILNSPFSILFGRVNHPGFHNWQAARLPLRPCSATRLEPQTSVHSDYTPGFAVAGYPAAGSDASCWDRTDTEVYQEDPG